MGLLAGYRVLDATGEWGLMAGRILADLGADVVQLEPPSGSPARACSPLAAIEGTTRSMYWEAFAAGKRGVALDPAGVEGRRRLCDLLDAADFLLVSEPPAALALAGLDWPTVSARNPSLVYVHVSPFGVEGPKARYAASDLVVWAASGALHPNRDGARPPVRLSSNQATLHAGADAAVGALIAHRHRVRTGLGQQVEVSAQVSSAMATISRTLAHAVRDGEPGWQFEQGPLDRSGSGSATSPNDKKWACRDGFVELHLGVGPAAGRFTQQLCVWMRDEGELPEELGAVDWTTLPDLMERGEADPEVRTRLRHAVARFLSTRSKEEVNAAAIAYRLGCSGIRDARDVVAAAHLAERGVWARFDDGRRPDLLPWRFAAAGPGAFRPVVRAPATGEHTDVVLAEWSGARPVHEGMVASSGGPAGRSALAGLKVLDLSWVVAGPMMGRALADFGATVVRAESGGRADPTRGMKPFAGGRPGFERSSVYANGNAGKLGIALDLSREEARAVARELADWADVVIESFAPGVMARWGLDDATLRESNPDLVMVSSCLGGQTGPLAGLVGFGNTGASLSGFQHLGGWPDRPPIGPFGPYTDYLAPRLGLAALLAALDRRDRTGEGCHIDLSQVECGVYFLSPEIADLVATGHVAGRRGNEDPRHAPHGVYATRSDGEDEFVAVAVTTDEQWAALAQLVGGPQLAADRRYRLGADRVARRGELEEIVAAWCAPRRASDVEEALQARGVPAHRSSSSKDFCEDAQLAYRNHLWRLPHPELGESVVEGPRYALSRTPGVVASAAPTLGQDRDEVLGGLLGWSRERIDALVATGALA